MCIAIVQRSATPIPRERMEICWKRNSDGGGIGWRDSKGKLHIYKSLDKEKFFNRYYKLCADESVQYPMLVHMRVKTSGPIDLANCHPFWVNKTMLFMHNGTIRNVKPTADMSDTRVFNEEILKPLVSSWKGFMHNEAIQKLIKEFITNSRVITLDSKGRCVIVNEASGHEEEDGNWYSNKTYEEYTARYTGGRTRSYGHNNHTSHTNRGATTARDKDGIFWYNGDKRRYIDGKMFQWCRDGAVTALKWREVDTRDFKCVAGGVTYTEAEADTAYKEWKEAYYSEGANLLKKKKAEEERQKRDENPDEPLLIDDGTGVLIPMSEFKAKESTSEKCDFCNEKMDQADATLIELNAGQQTYDPDLVYAVCHSCYRSAVRNWGSEAYTVIIGGDKEEPTGTTTH